MRGELVRKGIHILVGAAFAAAPFFISREYILIICSALVVGATLIQFWAWLMKYFLLDRSAVGAIYHFIGIGITAWYFLPESLYAYLFGVLALTFADSAAALIGRWIGKNRVHIGSNKRTLEGSLTFFAVTMLILYLLPVTLSIGTMIVIAVLLTHIELFAPHQTDNILIPLVGAALLYFLA